jgi:diaminobutyrate acetyltransferase
MDIKIRNATENDFLDVYNFVSNCKPLEKYYEHFYKIMLRYFSNSCFIAEFKDEIIGFVMGFKSQTDENTFFLWQIGVNPSHRGKKVAENLLKKLENTAETQGCNKMEVTVDPENIASQKLFEKNGYINISSKEGKIIEISGKQTVKDYYKPGRHFILYGKKIN